MTDTAAIDLRECPICEESKSVVEWSPTMMRNHVACLNCGCSVPAPNDDPSPEGAARVWNTRPSRRPDSTAKGEEEPFAYAYRYPSSYRPGTTEIRFSNGETVNGSKPIEAIPLYTRSTPPQGGETKRLIKHLEFALLSTKEFGTAVPVDQNTVRKCIGIISSLLQGEETNRQGECTHQWADEGPCIPLRCGSAATIICFECGAWAQARDIPNFRWRPAADLARSFADGEDACTPTEMAKRLLPQPLSTPSSLPIAPEGYVLVPREPTREMIDAAWGRGVSRYELKRMYTLMLSAAPQPPLSGQPTHREKLLGEALGNVLVHVGMIRDGYPMTGPELLYAAETYCASPPPSDAGEAVARMVAAAEIVERDAIADGVHDPAGIGDLYAVVKIKDIRALSPKAKGGDHG